MSFAWSYSSLSNYITCPKQYHAYRVAKTFKQEDDEHLRWGNEVHKAIELNLSTGRPLPERMQVFSPTIEKFAGWSGEFYVEQKVAVNAKHEPVEFFAKDAWARGVKDYIAIKGNKALDGDWKTGKKKDGSRQLLMSAAMTFEHFPQVDQVIAAYVWLQEQSITKETYYREDLASMWQSFDPDLRNLKWSYDNNTWPAKPSGLCKKYCAVKDCPYWGKGLGR